ncbi:hypothetical protein EUTSA_v10017654mg, partial [Eutrema salsugineum]
ICIYILLLIILTMDFVHAVIKAANSGPCIATCVPGKYEGYECNHDCFNNGYDDGKCDPKTKKCCCIQ